MLGSKGDHHSFLIGPTDPNLKSTPLLDTVLDKLLFPEGKVPMSLHLALDSICF